MVIFQRGYAIASLLALLGIAAPVQAEAPRLYYAWRSIHQDLTTCLDRSTAALASQQLSNIQVEGNSVSGTTEAATAIFVCLTEAPTDTTVMIMVASQDDAVALQLRETLKHRF